MPNYQPNILNFTIIICGRSCLCGSQTFPHARKKKAFHDVHIRHTDFLQSPHTIITIVSASGIVYIGSVYAQLKPKQISIKKNVRLPSKCR